MLTSPHTALRPSPRRRTTSASQGSSALTAVRRIGALLAIAGVLAVVLGLGSTMTHPAPAEAAAKVSVAGTPTADGESSLELSGSGFQSVQNGFGGIYVLFGWVDDPSGGWRPSKGGATGTNYRYVYDDETNPTGYQVFVAFPGSSTADAANGGEIAANGTWKATIRIPGATFTSYDRAQNEKQVDCTQVQCGIITIGAHGVTNANNESFTPVDFSAAGGGGEKDEKAAEAPGESEETKTEGSEAPEESETSEAAPADGSGGQAASEAGPAVAPVSSQPLLSTSWSIFFAILAGVAVIGVIIAVGLGFGIGGYLAVKSLLLGVSPTALEKERDRREKKRIRTKHRLERRRVTMQRRKTLQLAKLERSTERAAARTAHQGASTNTGTLPPQVIAFFEDEDRRRAGEGGGTFPDPEDIKDTRVLASVPDDSTRSSEDSPRFTDDDKDGDQ